MNKILVNLIILLILLFMVLDNYLYNLNLVYKSNFFNKIFFIFNKKFYPNINLVFYRFQIAHKVKK